MREEISSDIACPWCYIGKHPSEDALDMRFHDVRRGNTFDAHRLTHLAAAHGLGDATVERLFRARHTEGLLLSDHTVLERLAAEAGLPGPEVAEVLASGRFAAEVREDERTAASLGISAVPFFVIDRAMGASGAHPPEVLLQLLERGWAATTDQTARAS